MRGEKTSLAALGETTDIWAFERLKLQGKLFEEADGVHSHFHPLTFVLPFCVKAENEKLYSSFWWDKREQGGKSEENDTND